MNYWGLIDRDTTGCDGRLLSRQSWQQRTSALPSNSLRFVSPLQVIPSAHPRLVITMFKVARLLTALDVSKLELLRCSFAGYLCNCAVLARSVLFFGIACVCELHLRGEAGDIGIPTFHVTVPARFTGSCAPLGHGHSCHKIGFSA